MLAEVLNELGNHLPRMQLYAGLFPDSARLCDMLAAVYSDLMDFCILATTLFTRKSQYHVLFPVRVCGSPWLSRLFHVQEDCSGQF